jgi:integrase
VAALCDDYIRQYAQIKKRSWKEDDRMLTKDIIPLWGDREAASITPVEVVDLMDAVRLRGERAAVLLLAALRKAYSVAIKRHRVKFNPCMGIEIPISEKPAPRFLDFTELKTFLEKLETAPMFDVTKDILHLQLLTAARKGEVCELEWSEVNSDEKVWTLPKAKAKNKQSHRVMLSRQAMEIIERQPKKNKFVFASRREGGHVRGDSVNESLSRVMEHFELRHFTPHALRHSALTGLSRLGASPAVQNRISNHKDSTIGGHYDHYSHDKEARHWLQKFADHLDSLMEDSNVLSISRDAKTSGQ